MSIVVGDVQFVFRAATIGLNTAIREINRVNTAVRGYGTNLNRVSTQKQRYAGVQQRFTRNTKIQSVAMYELVKSLQIMLGPLSGVASRVSALTMLLQSGGGIAGIFLVALSGVTAGLAFLQHQMITTELAMEALESRFNSVGLGGQKFGETMEFVTKLSRTLGLNLETTASSYSKLTAAAQGSNLEGQGAKDIFIAVSEASAAMRLSVDQTAGAFKAIEQMISKGTVQAEELRGQLGERIYGAFQRTARAMGVTTKELGKLMKSGDALADDVLPKLAKELHKTFGEVAKENAFSLRGSWNIMRTELTLFLTKLSDISNMSGVLGDALRRASQRFREFTANKEKMEKLAHAIGFATEIMVKSIEFLIDNFKTLSIALTSFGILSGLKAFVAAGKAISGVAVGVKHVTGNVKQLGDKLVFVKDKAPLAAAGIGIFGKALQRFWPVLALWAAADLGDNLGQWVAEIMNPLDDLKFVNAELEEQKKMVEELKTTIAGLEKYGKDSEASKWLGDVEDLKKQLAVREAIIKASEELFADAKNLGDAGLGFEGAEVATDIYAGALEQLTTKFEELQAAANVTQAALISGFSEDTLTPIGKFLQQFKDGDFLVLPKELEQALAKVDALVKRTANDKALEDMLNSAKTEVDKLKESLDKANASRDYLILQGAVTNNPEFLKQLELLDAYIVKLRNDLDSLTNFSLKEKLDKLEPKDIAKELKSVFESTRTEAEKFNDELVRLKFLESKIANIYTDPKEQKQALEGIRRKAAELGEEYDKTTERGKMLAEITDTVREAMDELGKGIADSLVDSIAEGKGALESLSESFGNVLKNIAKTVMQFAIQMSVIKPLIDWLFGAGTYSGTKTPGTTGVLDGLLKKLIPATATAVATKVAGGVSGASIGTSTGMTASAVMGGLSNCCACCKGSSVAFDPESLVGKTIKEVGYTAEASSRALGKTVENSGFELGNVFINVGNFLSNTFKSVGSAIINTFKQVEQDKKINDIIGAVVGSFSGGSGGGSFGGMATGGSVTVGGSGLADSRFIMGNVSPGERIDFIPRNMQNSTGNVTQVYNINIDANGQGPGVESTIRHIARTEIIPQAIKAAAPATLQAAGRPRHTW